jgi:hypothetical protein
MGLDSLRHNATARPRWIAVFIAMAGLLGGCASGPGLIHSAETIRQHVIAVDGDGRPHDPATPNGRVYSLKEYRKQIACIFRTIDTFNGKKPDRKVLIFVHGGLNSPADSPASADSEMDCVMAAEYYPVYLDWNSDLLSTYGDHIALITQGETDNTVARALLTPGYVLADLGRAATRIPIVWINQFASDIQGAGSDAAALNKSGEIASTRPDEFPESQRWAAGKHGRAVAKVYEQLQAAQAKDIDKGTRKGMRVYIGPDYDVNPWHMAHLAAFYILTLPTKLITEPIIDWLGTPAWQVMARRTLIAFDGDLGGNPANPELDAESVSQREIRYAKARDFSTIGAMEVFREELQRVESISRPGEPACEITLVGHSMGTMVLNEWLRRDILDRKHGLYQQIVYMAAACSVRDFSRAVVPYLLENPQTQFYNLMLHPLADLRERGRGYDLPPRGSLLVWLDDFLTEPQTPLDRTLGRWDNIVSATEVIPKPIRKQVTLKAFALAPYNTQPPPPGQLDLGPQEHGQFRGQPYWRSDFWTDQNPVVTNPPCPAVRDGPTTRCSGY